jgi:hypothetical protein
VLYCLAELVKGDGLAVVGIQKAEARIEVFKSLSDLVGDQLK